MADTAVIRLPGLKEYLGETAQVEPTQFLVNLVNGLINETWQSPIDPVPSSIELLALEVGARPCRNPKGLASWTRSVDDGSRTERLPDAAARTGVYLTDEERAVLSLSEDVHHRARSIRMHVPGWRWR